jgi:uncharacterized protein (TIGR02001 family)
MKISLVTLTVLSTLALMSGQAFAGASANIGVTSNYMWRGQTQTQDDAAIQGGLDYSHDSGVYVGTWASNSKFLNDSGTELDLYAGYKKELKSGMSYDVGVIKYGYPDDNSLDFTELYAKAGYKGVGAEVDYTLGKEGDQGKEHDLYYALGYTGKLKNDWSYGVKVGHYDFKEYDASDYTHGQVSVTKSMKKVGDVTLALDKANNGANNPNQDNDLRASVSWKKNFDF